MLHLAGTASESGKWNTYFDRLLIAGFFDFQHQHVVIGDEAEAVFGVSTHCKVHPSANGPGTNEQQGIGSSRDGLNTKIQAMVDALGRLASTLIFSPGNIRDHTIAPELSDILRNVAVVGDLPV